MFFFQLFVFLSFFSFRLCVLRLHPLKPKCTKRTLHVCVCVCLVIFHCDFMRITMFCDRKQIKYRPFEFQFSIMLYYELFESKTIFRLSLIRPTHKINQFTWISLEIRTSNKIFQARSPNTMEKLFQELLGS